MAARSRDTETGDQEDDIHGHNYCQIFNMTHHTVVLHMQTNTKRLFLLLSCRKILEALRNSVNCVGVHTPRELKTLEKRMESS
ncbi:hypothetical protein YC2023_102219 [Brassica napus]